MSERKLKCTRCGKWFKAADYKHTLCPSCTLVERAKRPLAPVALLRGQARGAGVGTLDRPRTNGTAAVAPATPPAAMPVPAGNAPPTAPSAIVVNRQTAPAAAPARRLRVELTPAQREAIERRYLQLATPQEFDGIRSQIANELKLPRSLVKSAVNELRQRLGRPSWWELQQKGVPPEVVEAVKGRYLPLLPIPPIGIHRQLAEDLGFSALHVYRAIGQIRTEMGLPKFNERPEEVPEPVAAPVE